MKKLDYLRLFFSPFKRPKLRFYFGKIAVGAPYFYPRWFVPDSKNPGTKKAVPKKIGFDFVNLGWKTKWTDTDFRYEWSPLVSFVFFKFQIAVTLKVDDPDHYWTSFLYYLKCTDKSLSKELRIKKCIEEYPQNWITSYNGEEKLINYYNLILRKRYLRFVDKSVDRNEKLEKIGI